MTFEIVHIYNRNDTYHLTKQVLVDSAIKQHTYTFFYHIVSMSTSEFNGKYPFAHIIGERDGIEARLYLDVHPTAFQHIINYIQDPSTRVLSHIKGTDNDTFSHVIDLATIFALPDLITELRQD